MFSRSARSFVQVATSSTARCRACLRPIPPRTMTFLPMRFAATKADHGERLDQPPQFSQPYKSNDNQGQKPRRNPKAPAHKPPKRRLEAASLPLRNAPSVTRGPVLQCIAHTTAERYDLRSLATLLKGLGVKWDEVPEGDRDRAFVIGPWKGRGGAERLISKKDVRPIPGAVVVEEVDPRDMGFEYGERGEIWVFNSGSFVTWGLTEEEGRAFGRYVIKRPGAAVEVDVLGQEEYEVEEVDFVVDPTAKTQIVGNLILLGAPPDLSTFHHSPSLASSLARYTLSLSLSRSSALSVLEDRLDSHIARVQTVPRVLEKSGAQPMRRKEVIKQIGALMTLRMAVNTRGGGLDDTPEFYWSEPELEEYFDTIATEFEIKERIDAFNKKLDYAQEVQVTLRALLTEASGHRMEVIIIVLIAVEVCIVLIREGGELFEKLLHSIDFVMGRESALTVDELIVAAAAEEPAAILPKRERADLGRISGTGRRLV